MKTMAFEHLMNGREGPASAVNTYDDAIFTWGMGYGANGGLPAVLANINRIEKATYPDDLEKHYVQKFFYLCGFKFDGRDWVVDTAKKKVLASGSADANAADSAIRLRQIIHVTHQGRTMSAGDWVPLGGHAKMLRDVLITADKTGIAAVVLKHQKGMKEAWCIATNRVDLGAAGVVKLYARRFTIEKTLRDLEDNHFGMGLSATHLHSAQRRDRLLLLAAVAQALLTLLGAAGEACGLDRTLKANTVKTRTLSLYNQGCCWYRAIPTMREDKLVHLMTEFGPLLSEHAAFCEIFGLI